LIASSLPKTMDPSTNSLEKLQLSIGYIEQLLICCRSECGYALAVRHSQVTSHLRDKHQVPEEDRRGLTRYLTSIYPEGFCNPADLAPRDNGSDAHPLLRVQDGFSQNATSLFTKNLFFDSHP
jgi:hypothetical protein